MGRVIHVHIDIGDLIYEAARYAFRVLLAKVGSPVHYHRTQPTALSADDVLITYSRSRIQPSRNKHLVIAASTRLWDHYGSQSSLPPTPLQRIPLSVLGVSDSPRLQDPCILPYMSDSVAPGLRVESGASDSAGALVTGADLVASTFLWITRYEESLMRERDEVGRVPQDRLRVVQEGLCRRPLVDEYAEVLAIWLRMLGVSMTEGPRFRVFLTHDVDWGIGVKGAWAHADNALRTFYRETVRQNRIKTGLIGLSQWTRRGLGLLDEAQQFRDIVKVDAALGFPSFFFLMANGTNVRDARYDIGSPAVRAVIDAIHEAGGRTGLHLGLDAHGNPTQFRREWDSLRRADPAALPVARSHFLAFFAPATWRELTNLGFIADSTMGFSDHIGFRCGTSRAFRPFDIERREVFPLWELPMAVMDVNLFRARASDADRIAAVSDLAACVKAHRGCLVINWHNVYCFGHYQDVYRSILGSLRGAQGLSPDRIAVDENAVIW
jgi:hypothetical protein